MENGTIKGIFPQILYQITKNDSITVKYLFATYRRLKQLLQENQIDLILGANMNSESLSKNTLSLFPVATQWMILLKNPSNKKLIFSLFNLNGSTIAIESSVYEDYLKSQARKFGIHLNFILTDNPCQSLEYLKSRKADFALIDKMYCKDEKLIGVKETNFQLPTIELGIAFSKTTSASIVEKIENTAKSFKKDRNSIYYKEIEKYMTKSKNKTYSIWILYAVLLSIIVFVFLLFSIIFLRKKIFEKIDEIEEANFRIIEENKKLQNLQRRRDVLNRKIERSYQKLNLYMETLDRVYSIFSEMIRNDADVNEISDKILRFAIDAVEEADCGSISIKEKNHWKFLATVGHNKDKLNLLKLSSKYFIMPKRTVLFRNIEKRDVRVMPKELFEKFSEALVPIKESLLAPIHMGEDVSGNLALDISREKNKSFTKDSHKIITNMAAICSAFLTMKSYTEMEDDYKKEMMLALVRTLEIYDPYTEGHSEFVAQYSQTLTRIMGFDKKTEKIIYWAGLLHDIGKIGVPKDILNKPGPLTKDEYDIVKDHTIFGYYTLNASENLQDIALIVRHHHERYDGKGYPDGLKGKDIPLGARIVSIIDAWDAMTSERPYKKELSFEDALKELQKGSGTQFDPDIVKIFLKEMLHVSEMDLKDLKED